jgi:flagellar basal body-associated protein FliL
MTSLDMIPIVLTLMAVMVCYFWTVNKLMKKAAHDERNMNIVEHKQFETKIDLTDKKVVILTGQVKVLEDKNV